MTWASPFMFLLLIPLAGLLVFLYLNKQKKTATFKFSSLRLIQKIPMPVKARFAFIPFALKVFALGLIIAALARPQEVTVKVRKNIEGIDIALVLDISDSMLIEDMKPENRLEASKKTMKEFVEGRSSDRIGLVVFSGESYTRVPLTLDYPLLLKSLSEVETSRNMKMGTALGVALANAAGRLKESKAKSRIIVFLTDGENNSGTIDPETALEIAKEFGIKIYSIGMGVDGQAQLPVYIEDGRGNRIKQYRPMHSQVNEPLLRRFADETGGKFWRATTGQNLDEIFHEINNLEKTKIDVNQSTKYQELFQKYLAWGLALILFALLLDRSVFRRLA